MAVHVGAVHPQPVRLLAGCDGLPVAEQQQAPAHVVALGVEVRRPVVVAPPEIQAHHEVQAGLVDESLGYPQALGNGDACGACLVVALVDAACIDAPLDYAVAVLRQMLGVWRHRPAIPWHQASNLQAVVIGMQHLVEHPCVDLPCHVLLCVGSQQVWLVTLGVLCHQLSV